MAEKGYGSQLLNSQLLNTTDISTSYERCLKIRIIKINDLVQRILLLSNKTAVHYIIYC